MFFGRGRFQNGVIIQPVPQSQFDPNDEGKLIEFRNAIWYVAETNLDGAELSMSRVGLKWRK